MASGFPSPSPIFAAVLRPWLGFDEAANDCVALPVVKGSVELAEVGAVGVVFIFDVIDAADNADDTDDAAESGVC